MVNIDNKLSELIPRVISIESRLDKLEGCYISDLCDIKSSTGEILNEVRSSFQPISNISTVDSSDECSESQSVSHNSDQSDRGLHDETQSDQVAATKYGLVMSDSDLSDMALQTGRLLNCQVSSYDYSAGNVEPSMFNKNLEFVVIQDSGKVLDKYTELTTDFVQQLTGHVLVKLASSILVLQPDTQVFLGSLPPGVMWG
jgi:hypothetical protein